MNWSKINWSVAVWLGLAVLVSRIPQKPFYFGFIPHLNAFCGLIFLFVTGLVGIGRTIKAELLAYDPETTAAAKRVNEQIKLVATTINTVAVALASAFAIADWARNDEPDFTLMLISAAVALHFHTQARSLLGLLKDESAR